MPSPTIVGVAQTLHNTFEHAKREKLISENPVDGAVRPKEVIEEKEVMSFEESARAASQLDPTNRFALAVLIALEAGLRAGEVGGLKWDDIYDDCIHVRRTMLGMHHFRHQFATNLASNNINPRTMAALLGHSSPVISLQIYTHLQGSQTSDAIAFLDAKKDAVISAEDEEFGKTEDLAS